MGAMLTGSEIERAHEAGKIYIDPFCSDCIRPNSYDIHIGNTLTWYSDFDRAIDVRTPESTPDTVTETIPDTGYTLKAHKLYLISTLERVGSNCYVPMVTGRSSIGRYGISVHQEAGFGDVGFCGKWTLQVMSPFDFKIYPNMRIGQIYFLTTEGDIRYLYCGKYQGADHEIASRASMDQLK